ncbi:MAG: aminoacyl-tRNA hydrolase [Clostridia bacterium]|nr:aminoacyl-tRNA hydrolase [Clostridia bacterium]
MFELFKKISTDETTKSLGNVEYIVVGLGNPEKVYERTRHNAGFMAIDAIASRLGVRLDRAKFSALVGEAVIADKRVLLMKPQTSMNLSGNAVIEAARFYKIEPQNIVVLSDDITLDVGRLRVRRKGTHGGHNGLRSIEARLSSQEYQRIKIGVGAKPHPDYDLVNWVLGNFSSEDMNILGESFNRLYDGLCKILSGDTEGAMQICNAK